MSDNLRFDIAEKRLIYQGAPKELDFDNERIIEFNHRHNAVLTSYDLSM